MLCDHDDGRSNQRWGGRKTGSTKIVQPILVIGPTASFRYSVIALRSFSNDETPFARPKLSQAIWTGSCEWLLNTPKPPILFRGLFKRNTSSSPGWIARKFISPGHQKFTSLRFGSDARKSNHRLSVFAMNRLTIKRLIAKFPARSY